MSFERHVVDEDIMTSHRFYDDFILKQLSSGLDIGEKVVVIIYDKTGKEVKKNEYISAYSNSGFEFRFQDKGERNYLND